MIERNYQFLKAILNVFPDNIIFVEEQLIKRISTINIGILEETQKLFGSTKYSLNTSFNNLVNDEVVAKIETLI